MSMTIEDVLNDAPELKATDRCDRCGSQAYVLATKTIEGFKPLSLLFCAHDYAKYETKLASENWTITDQRYRLTAKD